jgi:hypothetical protein
MDVKCVGFDLFYALKRLEGCLRLRISGDIWRNSIAPVPPFFPYPAEGPRTEHLILAPSDTTGKSGEELLRLRILSGVLKSLQKEEDLRRAETKGWAKCDPPPQPN